MRKTIREYSWDEIARLIEAEESRDGNKLVNVPELVHGDTGNFVRFETERIEQAAATEIKGAK